MQKKINTGALLKEKMLKEDTVVLPENAEFYQALHNKIMIGVENAEIKKLSKWSQAWVFLEPGNADMKNKINFVK